jgi:hypothetical protein
MIALPPIARRGIKTKLVCDAVTSLCLFFNAIEEKVIDEEKLLDLERRHFETLCLLEATFPPSFFDLMLHLTAHLMREIWFLCHCSLLQDMKEWISMDTSSTP